MHAAAAVVGRGQGRDGADRAQPGSEADGAAALTRGERAVTTAAATAAATATL